MIATTADDNSARLPERVAPLIALQFAAIAWIVLNQFRFHLGLHAGDRSGLVFKGYLGAELFIVASGFLACQIYDLRTAAHRFSQASFLWGWLARVYPLHLAMTAVMGLLGVAAAVSRLPLPAGTFPPGALAANVLMVHAWGVLPTVSWNFPSWLISAMLFAYLVFPAIAWLALKGAGRAWVVVALPVALFVVLFQTAAARHILFTDMTAQIGALQTIPAFMLGAGLYRLTRDHTLPAGWGPALAVASGAWIFAAALLRLTDLVIFPAFGMLVYGLAETAKTGVGSTADWLERLGDLWPALLLVYLPTDILYFHAVKFLVPEPLGATAWLIWAGVYPVILAAAVAARHAIQRPAEAWLVARDPFKTRILPTAASV